MRVLLDTHAFLWFIEGDPNLSPAVRGIIEDVDKEVLVSAATVWEMSIKVSLGKLSLSQPLDVLIPEQMALNTLTWLPIEFRHLVPLLSLPFHHRDPFDRLLIAQCLVEGISIVSADSAFGAYTPDGLTVFW